MKEERGNDGSTSAKGTPEASGATVSDKLCDSSLKRADFFDYITCFQIIYPEEKCILRPKISIVKEFKNLEFVTETLPRS